MGDKEKLLYVIEDLSDAWSLRDPLTDNFDVVAIIPKTDDAEHDRDIVYANAKRFAAVKAMQTVLAEIIDQRFVECNCGTGLCDGTCTHGLVMAALRASGLFESEVLSGEAEIARLVERSRSRFEERVFAEYYLSTIQLNPNPPQPKISGALDFVSKCKMNRSEFVARDAIGNYIREDVSAAWLGWELSVRENYRGRPG